MRILLWSHAFYPSIGGLEAVSMMLAEEFVRRGHTVILITRTTSETQDAFPFRVIRRPGRLQLVRLVKECDVYLQNHLSLKKAWPLLFIRRPWVVAYHTWVARSGFLGRVRFLMLRHAQSISCSKQIAAHLGTPSFVVEDPYDDRIFKEAPGVARDKELIFVGRLVSSKGVHLLFDALSALRVLNLHPTLTVVGGGPEKDGLFRQVDQLGLAKQVSFIGPKTPPEIAKLLSRHSILVVPSVWQEPFGVVALEGIACGCVVVGSEGGGLKDAIGPCGVTFPNGDIPALAGCLAHLLRQPDTWGQYRQNASSHLQSHTRAAAADSYLTAVHSAYELVSI